jgi:hypothetical protein
MKTIGMALLGVIAAASLAAAQRGAPAPALLACGDHPDLRVICGVTAPEDLESTPDGRYLIVTQYASFRTRGATSDLLLLNLATRQLTPLAVTVDKRAGWGDPACSAPTALAPHGTSLTRRSGDLWQLFVVNHGGRESMEIYELKQAGSAWAASWHGCVVSSKDFNDVAALADGSFVGTHPTALNQPGAPAGDPFQGQPTGWVAKWTAAAGETELSGTRLSYPNGVVASPDGRYLYINGFGSRDVQKYDVAAARIVGAAKVDFMPDNLTWTPGGQLLAAGVKGARGNCPEGSATPCISAFGIARIEPAAMRTTPVFDSKDRAIASGVSVALEAGPDIYVGAFQGDRIVQMPLKNLPR